MDFKETYKKYLDGTATDEEKAFIEAEIEKARMVNTEIVATSGLDNSVPQETTKKRTPLRIILKWIITGIVTLTVITLAAFATVYGLAISNALDNIKVEPEEAKHEALEYTFMYARDHYGYTGSVMDMVITDGKPDERELEFKFPFSKCHYVYDFEFIAGNREFEVQVNSTTGMPSIVDIDILD